MRHKLKTLIRWLKWKLGRSVWIRKRLVLSYWTHTKHEAEVRITGLQVVPVNDTCKIDALYVDELVTV